LNLAICEEAGFNQSVFHYYCFDSKREAYRELVRTTVVQMTDFAAPVRPGQRSREGSPDVSLPRVGDGDLPS